MYIIQPAWLAEVGIIPKEIEVSVYAKIDAPAVRFSSPKLRARWVVTPSGIQVETDHTNEDCGEAIAEVIEKLPWTPLIAVENNAFYTVSLDELGTLMLPFPTTQNAPAGFQFVQRTVHYGLKREETVYNVQLVINEDEIELTVKARTELRGKKREEAPFAARRFFEDRQIAEGLVTHFFQSSLIYADNDQQSGDESIKGFTEQ
jgi:hypothetical protein